MSPVPSRSTTYPAPNWGGQTGLQEGGGVMSPVSSQSPTYPAPSRGRQTGSQEEGGCVTSPVPSRSPTYPAPTLAGQTGQRPHDPPPPPTTTSSSTSSLTTPFSSFPTSPTLSSSPPTNTPSPLRHLHHTTRHKIINTVRVERNKFLTHVGSDWVSGAKTGRYPHRPPTGLKNLEPGEQLHLPTQTPPPPTLPLPPPSIPCPFPKMSLKFIKSLSRYSLELDLDKRRNDEL
ncbi:uncharacterized protein [Macrobrachium rosenbergii]|uniref:uncharacterized protein n=1 Tax=Macrobrachium rosenbergii TaxID=79674 RepID=UPI0034D4271D